MLFSKLIDSWWSANMMQTLSYADDDTIVVYVLAIYNMMNQAIVISLMPVSDEPLCISYYQS